MQAKILLPIIALVLSGCVTETSSVTRNQQTIHHKVNNVEAAKTRLTLALQYLKKGNTTQAKFNLERALEFAPKMPRVHYTFAHFYERVGEFESAKNAYQTALKISPDNPNTLNNYGTLLCRIGEYQLADEQFLKAIEIPSYLRVSKSYENLAICAMKQDDFDLAEQYYSSALKHDGRNQSVLISTAALLYAKSELHSAESLLKKYSSHGFISPRSLLLEHLLHLQMGHVQKAEQISKTLIRAYPNSKEAVILLKQELDKNEFWALKDQYRRAQIKEINKQTAQFQGREPKIKITRKKPSKSRKNTTLLSSTTSIVSNSKAVLKKPKTLPLTSTAKKENKISAVAVNEESKTNTSEINEESKISAVAVNEESKTNTSEINVESKINAIEAIEKKHKSSDLEPKEVIKEQAKEVLKPHALKHEPEVQVTYAKPSDVSSLLDLTHKTTIIKNGTETKKSEVVPGAHPSDVFSMLTTEDQSLPPEKQLAIEQKNAIKFTEKIAKRPSQVRFKERQTNPTKVIDEQVKIITFGDSETAVGKVRFYETDPSKVTFSDRRKVNDSYVPDTTMVAQSLPLLNRDIKLPNLAMHITKPGENMFSLSVKYNIKLSQLLFWNGLKESDRVPPGREIYLNNPNVTHAITHDDSLYKIATRYGLLINDLMRWNNLTPDVTLKQGHSILIVDPSSYAL